MLKRDLYYERIPTKSLRDDVRYLGNILGNVIKQQEGINLFRLVEDIRRLSKANAANTVSVSSNIVGHVLADTMSPGTTQFSMLLDGSS